MHFMRTAVASVMATIICICLSTSCRADLLTDARDIATDPLKIGMGSKNILDSVVKIQQLIQDLNSLEIKTDDDIAARLQDIKTITNQVIAAVNNGVAVSQQLV